MTLDPYRNAFEKALSDIAEIAARFEQLRTRRSHIENLIAVLEPMVDAYGTPTYEPQEHTETGPEQIAAEMPELEAEPAGYSFLEVPSPLPESTGDPFERRARSGFRFRGLAAQR